MDKFFEENKVFTTSLAKKNGYTKNSLKAYEGVVVLGTFPVRDKRGNTKLEKVYTYDPDLAQLTSKAKKLSKKNNRDDEQVKELVSQIETKVRTILYGEGEDNASEKED